MAETDDDDFLELLAGRKVPGADEGIVRGARLLRWNLQMHQLEPQTAGLPASTPEAEARLGDLLRAIEAQGGFAPAARRVANDAGWMRRLARIAFSHQFASGFVVAATVVLAVGLFVALPRDQLRPASEQIRGGQAQVLASDDPARTEAELVRALRAAGAQVVVSQTGDRQWDLEVNYLPTAGARIGHVLTRYGLSSDRTGALVITVRPR